MSRRQMRMCIERFSHGNEVRVARESNLLFTTKFIQLDGTR